MIEIMTVCTGNICRSPLAALVIASRLSDLGIVAYSAGVRGLADAPMTADAVDLAVARGIPAADAAGHRSRFLTERHLARPDLILAMTRDHRRAIAELAPARLRSTFTMREFARLAASLTDAQIRAAAADAVADADGQDASARLRAASALLAGQRGLLVPPADPLDDDVVDPYGRSRATYELSGAQLDPAIDQVERVVRLAAGAA